MKEHDLKCWPDPFEAMWQEVKTFEWRKNDRDFKVGDILRLREWDPAAQEYTGREKRKTVMYIAHGPAFGIPEGYCVMSIRKVVELRKCEKCGGPGPTLYDEKTQQMCCEKCHHNPKDVFFIANSITIGTDRS